MDAPLPTDAGPPDPDDFGPDRDDLGPDRVDLGPNLDDLYDEVTLARIDGPAPRTRARTRLGLSGAVLAGMMLGVAVVYDPEPDKPTVVEQDADGEPFDGLPVQVRIDPGNPRGSEIVLRRAAS